MRAQTEIPELSTFNHVLFRPDWNPVWRYEERNYGEIAQSRCVQWPDGVPLPKPVRGRNNRFLPVASNRATCAMFVRGAHLRTRMEKLGWVDVTDSWMAVLTKGKKGEEPVVLDGPLGAPVAAPVPPGEARLSGKHAQAPDKAPQVPDRAPGAGEAGLLQLVAEGSLAALERALTPGLEASMVRQGLEAEQAGRNRKGAVRLLEEYLHPRPVHQPEQAAAAAQG